MSCGKGIFDISNTPKYWIKNVKNNFLVEKRCKFCGKEKSLYICTPKCWSDGRVARHSSAKAATAVRIRFRPHQNSVRSASNAVFLLFCTVFVRHISIDNYLLYKFQLIYNR